MSSPSVIAADTEVINTRVFYSQLDRLMGAAIGVVIIRTREQERAKNLIHEWASMRSLDFHAWTRLRGFWKYKAFPLADIEEGSDEAVTISLDPDKVEEFLRPEEAVPGTDQLYDALDHLHRRFEEGASKRNHFCGLFMGVTSDELAEPLHQAHIREHVQRAYNCEDRIFMLCPPGMSIPTELMGDVEILDLQPPSYAELNETLEELRDSLDESLPGFLQDEDDIATVIQNGMGMTNQEFEIAVSLAIVDLADKQRKAEQEGDKDFELTVDDFVNVIRRRKLEILKQTQILELMRTVPMKNVGGLDLLKQSLQRERKAFTPEARGFGINFPKGFVAVGPSGTGKSLICSATSSELGIPAIRFDINAVYNALVGSSEERMRMCLSMVEDMAPCIMFIDEIDKALSSDGGNDGGVSARILGTLLTWMQEKADKEIPVYVIASANDVTRIPPEVLRKGRFDRIWAVSFPSIEEREAIVKIHVEKRGHKLPAEDYRKIAKQTETFVGAELESVVEAALLDDFYKDADKLTFETLSYHADKLIPQAKAFPKRIAAMAAWAKQNAEPASSQGSFGQPDEEPADKDGRAPGIRPRVKRKPRVGSMKSSEN